MSDALRQQLWVDYDLKSAERRAHDLALRAVDRADLRAYDREGLKTADVAETVAFVGEVAKTEQERETNLNTCGAAVATVAGVIVTVSSAIAKPAFEMALWSD